MLDTDVSSENQAVSSACTINGDDLTLQDVLNVARKGVNVRISEQAKKKVAKSRKLIEKVVGEVDAVYGLNTGFGHLSDVRISDTELKKLQVNMIRSHAAGVGEPLAKEVVRAMMLLRANALAKAYSGIKLETLDTLIEMINQDICPFVPEIGSIGASGDLVPLSHIALVLIGEGEAFYENNRMPGKEALSRAGIKPITLEFKEGLSLVNGTQAISAIGALAICDAENLLKHANLVSAMTLEALHGKTQAFSENVGMARLHPGQSICAGHILKLINGSEMVDDHAKYGIQDAYSLRCIPQVHGAILDTIKYAKAVVETEINSATDNPLVFPSPQGDTAEIISCGNFHAQPVAFAMDYLSISLAVLGSISERRIERLNNPNLSFGLPAFLSPDAGINSGFMIPQYTAAALVSENKTLATPASVDSIPVSANKEDHVSMGMGAARKTNRIIRNLERILAIELMCAAQALDIRCSNPGTGSRIVHGIVRKYIPKLEEDRTFYADIEKLTNLIRSGEIIHKVEEQVGELALQCDIHPQYPGNSGKRRK